jgi:very-short-patch-repair endonuclease/DNA-directed RNA polymerase subunit RPC12/RpoP
LSREYVNKKQKMEILHKICGRTFEMNSDGFLSNGNRCKYCSPFRSWSYTTDEFKRKVAESHEGEEYDVVGSYKNTHTHILMKHKKCGKTFEMRPNNFLLKGNRCPHCPRSLGEERIRECLDSRKINYVPDTKIKGLGNLRFDFKVYRGNSFMLIEYDGRFHFEPFSRKKEHVEKHENQRKNDKLKTDFCKERGIKLLRIHYSDIDNIEAILERTFNDYPL